MPSRAAHAWFEGLPNPAVIAHRGASIEAPENTLAAFNLAVTREADAVELDVMLCGTGEPVVIHDDTVDRTTDGTGEVAELSLAALRALDAGGWFDGAYRKERIPTIDEVFESLAGCVFINIEIKNYRRPFDGTPAAVVESVRRHGMAEKVFFSSFNPFALRTLRRLMPACPAGLLVMRGFSYRAAASLTGWITGHDAVHPEISDVTETMLQHAQRRGRPVFAYTANEPDEIRRLFDAGVAGVITDDPALAVRVRQAYGRRH